MLEMILIIAAVLLDRLTKYLVCANIYNSSAQFIPGFIGFRYCENTGAAFSIFNSPTGTVVLTVISAVMAVVLIYAVFYLKKKNAPRPIGFFLAMIAGGAIGNLIDRLFLGYVIDFIETEFMNFAIFNVADCFVTVGVALLIIYLVFTKKGREFFKGLDSKKAEGK